MNNFDTTISRVILQYMLEKKKELNKVCKQLQTCTDIIIRRILRIKKKQLIAILNDAHNSIKLSLKQQLGISYKDVKNYPDLIEVKRKEMYLKNCIS